MAPEANVLKRKQRDCFTALMGRGEVVGVGAWRAGRLGGGGPTGFLTLPLPQPPRPPEPRARTHEPDQRGGGDAAGRPPIPRDLASSPFRAAF